MSIAAVALGVAALAGCSKEEKKTEPVPEPEITGKEVLETVPFTGGTVTYEFETNRAWKVTETGATQASAESYEPEFDTISGNAGKNKIKITFPANKTQQEIKFSFTITLDKSATTKSVDASKAYTKTVEVTIDAPSVTDAAGNVYKVVYLKDGNFWMAENLRYIPDGQTVSEDPKNGEIWYPYDFSTLKAVKSDEIIKTNGLFYTLEAALGTSLTTDNAAKQEKAQGICPDGWHIPSFEEAYVLFGGTNSIPAGCTITEKPYTNAYYYNADYKGGNVKEFNETEPYANLKFVGGVSISGSGVAAYQKANTGFENFPMTNFWTSTLYKTATTDTKELDKVNSQNFVISLMAVKNNPDGKISMLYGKMKGGNAVRCVMDQPAN